MRRLTEWTARANSTTQADDMFKERFMKLAKHIEDCYDWSTIYYVSEWELELEFRSGYAVFNLTIDVNSNNITVVVLDTKAGTERMTATVAHNGWSKLLDILKKNGIIQNPKLCECYDSPLLEWTYQQNPVQKSNASTTNDYTKKFRDMLEYHVQNFYHGHTHAKLVKHNIVKVAANCFLYEEQVSLGGISHKFELAGAVSMTTGDWVAQGFKDGQRTSNQNGSKGFEEMFDYLRDSHILVLPYNGTKDYKQLVENFKEKYEMKLHEEFKEYENLWEDLDEWVDRTGNSSAPKNTSTTSTTQAAISGSSPLAAKLSKKRAATPGLGKYKTKFSKLLKHLDDIHTIDYNYKYGAVGDHHLCVVFDTQSGDTYYLDVTTTRIDSSNFTYKEYWDFVIEDMNTKDIVDRGFINGYDGLLDKLLAHGLINSKSACQ